MNKIPKATIIRSTKNADTENKSDYVVSYNTKTSTPARQKQSKTELKYHIEYSPVLSQHTRDICDVDVVWDWNSPRSKKTTTTQRAKRPHAPEEKLPLKRTPSSNQIPVFNKLKEELEALKEQLAEENKFADALDDCQEVVLDNNEILQNKSQSIHSDGKNSDLDDLFNDDSIEEQLVLCSQEIEKELETATTKINEKDSKMPTTKAKKFNFKNIKSRTTAITDILPMNPPNETNNVRKEEKICEDSFELMIATFKDEEFEVLSQAIPHTTKQNNSYNKMENRSKCLEMGLKINASSPQLRKTNSFDDTVLKKADNKQTTNSLTSKTEDCRFSESLPKNILEEIERKRQEALAKLEAKKKQEIRYNKMESRSKCLEMGLKINAPSPQLRKANSFDDTVLKKTDNKQTTNSLTSKTENYGLLESPPKNILEEIERKRQQALAKLEAKKKQEIQEVSPVKCLPEEIEQKRLQALAKLEAKRKQDMIERNRLEALKRLEMNKKKRALQTQNSLQVANSLPRKIHNKQ